LRTTPPRALSFDNHGASVRSFGYTHAVMATDSSNGTPIANPCAVSIARFGQMFMHRMQLSQRYDQKGRPRTSVTACTGHCLTHTPHASHARDATNDLANQNRPMR